MIGRYLRQSRAFSGIRLLHTEKQFNVAVIGSGPAGFYTTHHLLKKSPQVKVDIFERLPAPFGLSRYGVAPDHPEVKNCEEYLENAMDTGRVRFFGNTTVGSEITLVDLQKRYHAVVLAYGCASADNKLSIPGSDLSGIISARHFVNWYNGHPLTDTPEFDLSKVENVTIIGNGNVAIDIARVLLLDPSEYWHKTDIADEAVRALKSSSVKKVRIVARRSLLHSAFTNKEIRELLDLSVSSSVRFDPIDEELVADANTQKLNRIDKRKVGILTKEREFDSNAQKSWCLDYLRSPVEFIAEDGAVTHTKFQKNRVEDGIVVPTDEFETFQNDLVILSIGYYGVELPGLSEIGISFSGGRLPNIQGRCISDAGTPVVGWYTAGWVKNGPKGVIATTMMDSFDTAETILLDFAKGTHLVPSEPPMPQTGVDWNHWKTLNEHELKLGSDIGKSRMKVSDKDEMVRIAKGTN